MNELQKEYFQKLEKEQAEAGRIKRQRKQD